MELLHLRPVQLGPEMMLGVVPIVKPEQIIDFLVRTHAPGNRFVRISPVMQKIAVQIRKTMPQVIERQKEKDEFPIQNAQENKETEKRNDLEYAPIRVRRILSFDLRENRFWVVAHIAEKNVAPDILRFAIMAVPVNR